MQVSVITPCYNSAEYLRDNIESVARQNRVDVEHIIVDDFSSDESRALLQEYEARLPHLKVVYLSENIGQSRARNAGLEVATGDYVAFLDSDDWYVNETVLYAWLTSAYKNDADLVRADYLRVIEDTGETRPAVSVLSGQLRYGLNIENAPELVNNTSCWLLLYKRSFLIENEIAFSPLLRQREDRPFFLLALLHAKTVNLIPDHLIAYRVHSESTMRNVSWDQLDLFATHLTVVSGYMRASETDRSSLSFRRANLLYYVKNIIEYWGPLLIREEAPYRAEFERFFAATRQLFWDVGQLKDDTVLDRVEVEQRDNFFFDFAWFLLRRGAGQAFRNFIQNATITLGDVAVLTEPQQDESSDRWHLDQEAIFTYLRYKPPLVVCAEELPHERQIQMLPHVVLHAGMIKTGSSSLQVFFELNRFVLLERYGIYYPFTGLEHGTGAREHRTSGHAGLIGNLLAGQTVVLRKLALEVAALPIKPRVVVLSAENIVSERFWGHGDAPKKLAASLRGVDLKVVVYFRRQEDWLESAFVESVTSPGLRFKGSPLDFAMEQRKAGILDFTAVDTAWRESFAKDQLVYRSYEQARDAGDVIDDFISLVGIDDGAAGCLRPQGAMRNESVPTAAAYLISKLNCLDLPRRRIVELNAQVVEAAKTAVDPDLNISDVAFYGNEDRDSIASLYDLSNRAFFNNYIGEVPAYASKPNLKAWSEAGVLPVALIDEFFELFVSHTPASSRRGASLPVRSAGARANKQRAAENELMRTSRMDPQLAAFSARWRTRLRAAIDRRFRAVLEQAQAIDHSGIFDSRYYLAQAPVAARFPGGPIMHFMTIGATEGLNPSEQFDVTRYLALNSDVAAANMNPLYHYVKYGEKERRALA